MPVRMCLVTKTNGYGGAERHVLELIDRLLETATEPIVFCVLSDPFTERLVGRAGVKVVRWDRTPRWPWEWRRLFRVIRPDIIVFVHGEVSAYGCSEYLGAKLAGVKTVYAIQHLTPRPLPAWGSLTSLRGIAQRVAGYRTRYLAVRMFCASLTTKAICVSEAVRSRLVGEQGYARSRTIVVRNGVDLCYFAPSVDKRAEMRERLGIGTEALLVCASRLTPIKGLDVLLDALALVAQCGYRFRCVIVGDGPARQQILARRDALGLSESVILVGFQADVRPYLQAADVFLLTSFYEGLPLAVLEAMSCGLPCVVTDVGGNSEAVGDGREGFVVPAGSSDSVAAAIAKLIADPERRANMGRSARRKVSKAFDVRIQMKQLAETLLQPR